jgi:hypothetical protein
MNLYKSYFIGDKKNKTSNAFSAIACLVFQLLIQRLQHHTSSE